MTSKKFPLCSKYGLTIGSIICWHCGDKHFWSVEGHEKHQYSFSISVPSVELALSKAKQDGANQMKSAYEERIAQLESDAIQQKVNYRKALENAKEQGKLDQYNQTIALLYNLRTNRFIYNDEMKLAIDMIKDEITRRLKSQLSKSKGAK
jgi:hypothetical protein